MPSSAFWTTFDASRKNSLSPFILYSTCSIEPEENFNLEDYPELVKEFFSALEKDVEKLKKDRVIIEDYPEMISDFPLWRMHISRKESR